MKNLSKVSLRITEQIDNYLLRYPHSKPKQVCKDLGIDYGKYKNMVSTEKCKIRRYLGLGRPHKPHRQMLSTEIGAVELDLVKAVCVDRRVKGRWYRTSNRNRMMCFIADQASVKVWETGTVRVEPHVAMSKKDLADFFFDTLNAAAGIPFEAANMLADSLVTASRHKVFPVAELVPRFRIDHYKESLGLEIYADDSHPYSVEIKEDWPDWFKMFQRVMLERAKADTLLAKNIETHVAVEKNIREATEGLKMSTEKLNELLDKRLRDSTIDFLIREPLLANMKQDFFELGANIGRKIKNLRHA